MEVVAFTVALPIVVIGIAVSWSVVHAYRMYGGARVVTCPETGMAVVVELDARRAAVTRLSRNGDYRLKSCSRWPGRQDCGQECLSQINGVAPACRVPSRAPRPRRQANCALCGLDLEGHRLRGQKPVLMSSDRKTRIEWDAVAPENLLRVLSTHSQICWNCHMAETFRVMHPRASVAGPPRKAARPGIAS
jgi:hypothetical protein